MPGPVRDKAEAFQQLEAVMLRQMLHSSGAFRASDSPGAQLRTDMFIETLADAVAKAGGLGIAKMLERQMGGATGQAADRSPPGMSMASFPSQAASAALAAPTDDLDDPNSTAPLPEDPSAPSIDDYQPSPVGHPSRGAPPVGPVGAPLGSAAAGLAAPAVAAQAAASGEVTNQITSGFGTRVHPLTGDVRMHTGVDLRAAEGAPIRAAAAGIVREAGARGGYGNAVEIDHGNGTSTLYAHASALVVKPGQRVERGETVGLVGHTGQATGPHLHFELRRDGRPVDPTSVALPTPAGRALNRYRGRVEDSVGGTPSGAGGGKS